MEKISTGARRERAAYMREYRKRHPEKTREANRRYWEKKANEREAKTDAENASTEQ